MNKKYKRSQKRTSNRKLVSKINPSSLIKKAKESTQKEYKSDLNFTDFDLNQELTRNIQAKGYNTPSEIQEKSIPSTLKGNDLIGIASTGTGKTAAFLIPIINELIKNNDSSALVVVPTRELAIQVHDEYQSLARKLNLRSSFFIGGTNLNKDMYSARSKNRFIVGTPGRLNDLINRRSLNIKNTSILVLDEFDRMLDMGFIHDVRKISNEIKNRNQTMLFSATLDNKQDKIIKELVNNPTTVKISSGLNSSDNVNQDIIKVKPDENKLDVLLRMLNKSSFEKVILFAETKRSADKINKKLKSTGLLSDVIHGNKSQKYRNKAINLFRSGKTEILVATDVAARGIDVSNVTHVINYQIPQTMDSYIHRIGRTGRAGKIGSAFTFIN